MARARSVLWIEHSACSMVILLLVVLWTDRKAVWALDKLKMRLIWRAVDLDCSSNLDSFWKPILIQMDVDVMELLTGSDQAKPKPK